jgi:hypothetical protein
MAGGGGRKTWSGDDAKVVSYLLSNIIHIPLEMLSVRSVFRISNIRCLFKYWKIKKGWNKMAILFSQD